jgi:hypothetical protein
LGWHGGGGDFQTKPRPRIPAQNACTSIRGHGGGHATPRSSPEFAQRTNDLVSLRSPSCTGSAQTMMTILTSKRFLTIPPADLLAGIPPDGGTSSMHRVRRGSRPSWAPLPRRRMQHWSMRAMLSLQKEPPIINLSRERIRRRASRGPGRGSGGAARRMAEGQAR